LKTYAFYGKIGYPNFTSFFFVSFLTSFLTSFFYGYFFAPFFFGSYSIGAYLANSYSIALVISNKGISYFIFLFWISSLSWNYTFR